jgi:AsmA-like C-terminal region
MPQPLNHNADRSSRWLRLAVILALGIAIAACFLVYFWPFRRDAVMKELEAESYSKVTAASFHETYFPRPGCFLEQVVFQHNPKNGTPPLITAQRIRIEGSFSGLFARHVKLVRVEGLRILVPPLGSEQFETPQRSSVVIDDLVADGATLEVASRVAGNQPLKFTFRGFTISDVGSNVPAFFKATLSNSEPPGEITTTGKFGPWKPDDVGSTAVSGEYYFEHADLGSFGGIRGFLASSGKYSGTLEHIDVAGSTDVPLFAVSRSSHQTQLHTQFNAVVNAENGDVSLQKVSANFRQTTVSGQGSVAGKAGQAGKTVSLEITGKDGRIQDFLLLFIRSPQAPMSGIVTFKANVSVPPEDKPFLEKVELQADFGINGGSFTPGTQQNVNNLSEGGSGEKKPNSSNDETDTPNVLSNLKGHLFLRNGTATFSTLSFSVPGALAQMRGTYNVISQTINLHGTLKTVSDISKTTSGVKSLMLKMLDPFFKHKPSGYVAPVKITGTYDHPLFGLDLGNSDNSKNQNAKAHTPRLPDQSPH